MGRNTWAKTVLPQEIIRAKRDGAELAPDAIAAFVAGLVDGAVTEGQAAAFAMAVVWRGMTDAETVALTLAMRDSGTVLDWRALGETRPVVDKHSTGGIGDKTSLILAPLLAACGCAVPMVSGRGLGHTGGTLDKMDAIPGYVSQPNRERLVAVVGECGFAIVGATDDLAPADRRLYAIRDVTATVESLPLITASILSKKLAEGAQSLVFDVKVGSGAFLPSEAAARELANNLTRVLAGAGVAATALLTAMDQALGRNVGNALEVTECVTALTGGAFDPRLRTVTMALTEAALRQAGLDPGLAERRLADGAAAGYFERCVAALGGPANVLAHPFAAAPIVRAFYADRAGVVAKIDARGVGLAVIELGGGRTRPQDAIDHRVGFTEVAGLGEPVGPDRPLCVIHAATEDAFDRATARLRSAFRVGDSPGPILATLV